jgi:hypothetical protein
LDILKSILGALLLSIALTTNVLSHSWYDPDCCNTKDCSPITTHKLQGSILTFKTELFKDEIFQVDMTKMPANSIRPSKDQRLHACVIKFPSNGQYYVRCLYVGGGA